MKLRRTPLTIGALLAVVTVFSVSFALTIMISGDGRADTFPGAVEQSGAASDGELTVEVQRAVFAATGVDIELVVASEDPSQQVAGILPLDATMEGETGLNARIDRSGSVILSFPAESWPSTGETADLHISAIQVRGGGATPFERLTGDWLIPITLPRGEAAEAAREMQALSPVTVEVAGEEVVIDTYRTPSSTIVRYLLPDRIIASGPPTLRADGDVLTANRFEQTSEDEPAEVWFGPTADDSLLTLVIDRLSGPDPVGLNWTVHIGLEPFDPPDPSGDPEPLPLDWTRLSGSDGPEIDAVELARVRYSPSGPYDSELRLWLEGIWEPGPPTPDNRDPRPVVIADGSELEVTGVGVRYEDTEGGRRTVIYAKLPDSSVPATIQVQVSGGVVALDPIEVVLQP